MLENGLNRELDKHPISKQHNCGYSLIELVIAVGLLGYIMSYLASSFTMQQQTYSVIEQVSETQSNSLTVAALIERDIRNAGFMVPPFAAACGADSTSGPDTLFLSDSSAILPADQLPSHLRSAALGGDVIGTPTVSGTVWTMVIDDVVLDETPSFDTNSDGTADSDFQVGAGVILVDRNDSTRGVACGLISAVNTAANTITFDLTSTSVSGVIAVPGSLVLVPAIAYAITTPGGATQPEIQRNGQAFARDTEDLQVAWFFDDNDDGIVDTLEYRAAALTLQTADGAVAVAPVPATTFDTSAVDGSLLREIRFNVVSRTRGEDPRNPISAGIGQSTENRATNIPAVDGRRRRVYSATVRLRNLS